MRVSVVLCTYNPDRDLLDWALDSVGRQTTRDFETVIVDNNSRPALDEPELRRRHTFDLRVIREPRQGLIYARCTGIAATSGDLIVFLDDDNRLDPDYVERAVAIAEAEASIGHFGGIARAELAADIPTWKRRLLPYLGVRDHGSEPITSCEDRWGMWEPIGAGMVTRRAVATEFVKMAEVRGPALGRNGTSLMSGEDSLMARAASRLGFACSYQPSLGLTHFIKMSRLRAHMLARIIEGHGRSYVVLERILGRPVATPRAAWIARELPLRLLYRLRGEGLRAGAIAWLWDLGYVRQARMPE